MINIFKELLRPDGVIYVAAKTHYFGVGGSIQEFQLQLEKNNFRSHLVWQTTEGLLVFSLNLLLHLKEFDINVFNDLHIFLQEFLEKFLK